MRRRSPFVRPIITLFVMTIGLLPHIALAQLPYARLNTVFPAGGQQGTTFDVRIVSAADLDETDMLWFGHPGIAAQQTGNGNTFKVSIAPTVPRGTYEVRAGGVFGLSNPRFFAVGNLKEISEGEPNNTREQPNAVPLNSVANGTISGKGDVDWFRFENKTKQRTIIECRALGIDSRLSPVVEVFDQSGRRMTRVRTDGVRDPVVDVGPGDGPRFIRISDAALQNGNEFIYRLSVHTGPRIDFVFPNASAPRSEQPVMVFGRNLPGGETAFSTPGRNLQIMSAKVVAPNDVTSISSPGPVSSTGSDVDGFTWRFPKANPVLMQFARRSPQVEVEPNNTAETAQQINVPTEIAGQFQQRSDIDVFRFNAKKGQNLIIETFGERGGSTADPYFVLERISRDKNGKEKVARITAQDDSGKNIGGNDFLTAHSDPIFRLQVPEDATYQLKIRDRYYDSRGDPSLVYRLAIREPQPDFRLIALAGKPGNAANQPLDSGAVVLRRGGNGFVSVYASRRDGLVGPIRIFARKLPVGVTAKPIWLGSNQSNGTLIFEATEDAAPGHSGIEVVAEMTTPDGRKLLRVARPATIVRQVNQAASRTRLSHLLMMSVVPGTAPLRVAAKSHELHVNQSRQIIVPVELTKRRGFDQNVNITFTGGPKDLTVEAKPIAKGATTGDFRFFVGKNVKPGTWTLLPRGDATIAFRKHPGRITVAQAARAKVVKAETQAKIEVENSKRQVQASEQQLKDLKSAETQLRQKVPKLKIALDQRTKVAIEAEAREADAAAKRKALELPVKSRRQAAAALANAVKAVPGDKDLLAQKNQAEKLRADAEKTLELAVAREVLNLTATAKAKARMEVASLEFAQANMQIKAYGSKITAAGEAVTAAQKTEAAAQAKLKATSKAKIEADKQLKEVLDKNKPQNIKVYEPGTPLVFHVAKSPVAMGAKPASGGNVKRGQSVDIKVSVKREGYAAALQLKLLLPTATPGVSCSSVTLNAGADKTKLIVTTKPDTKTGKLINAVVRAEFNHEGRAFKVDAPVQLQVQQ